MRERERERAQDGQRHFESVLQHLEEKKEFEQTERDETRKQQMTKVRN